MKSLAGKRDKSQYLFSNRDLRVLILPLIVEQFLAVLVGMADSIMVASVGRGCGVPACPWWTTSWCF